MEDLEEDTGDDPVVEEGAPPTLRGTLSPPEEEPGDPETGKATNVGAVVPMEPTELDDSAGAVPGRRTPNTVLHEAHWSRSRAGISAATVNRSLCPQPGQGTVNDDGETEEL